MLGNVFLVTGFTLKCFVLFWRARNCFWNMFQGREYFLKSVFHDDGSFILSSLVGFGAVVFGGHFGQDVPCPKELKTVMAQYEADLVKKTANY